MIGPSRLKNTPARTATLDKARLDEFYDRTMNARPNSLKLSIALCSYDGEQFLQEQLDSIAAQSRLPDELIVCDDRSADGTVEILGKFAAQAAFPVRIYANEEKLGTVKNFEQAIELCTGDVIALADQDDIWHTKKLERIEQIFLTRSSIGLVFTDAELIDQRSIPLGERLWQRIINKKEQRLIEQGRIRDVLIARNVVTGATMAFRSEYRQLVLPIPLDISLIHDGWIAVLVAMVADTAAIGEPLISYRQHPRQQLGAKPLATTKPRGNFFQMHSETAHEWRLSGCQAEIDHLTAIYQRLISKGEDFRAQRTILTIKDRAHHLRVRGSLQSERLARIKPVLAEICSLRYHRYSNGWRSAAKDLFI